MTSTQRRIWLRMHLVFARCIIVSGWANAAGAIAACWEGRYGRVTVEVIATTFSLWLGYGLRRVVLVVKEPEQIER